MELESFFTVSRQTAQFFMSVALGAALGILYDCFRAVRIVFPFMRRNGAVLAADIIFAICFGAALFLFGALFCRGSVRFFCAAGSVLGFILYIVTVGSLITGILRAVVSAVYGVLHKVYSAVSAPIVKLAKRIYPKKFNIFVHSYENCENEK